MSRCNKKQYRKANYYSLGAKLTAFKDKLDSDKTIQSLGGTEGLSQGIAAASPIVSNALSGGRTSSAGEALTQLGGIASAIPGPYGAITGTALNTLGGITNNVFGSKLNVEKIAEIEGNINAANSFTSNAGDFDALSSTINNAPIINGFSQSDIGSDGMLGSKAKKMYKKLKAKAEAAEDWVNRSIGNNADNITLNTLSDLESNYFATGGDIAPMFSNDVITIGNGGTHESNPNEGIQVGVDNEGIPNLLEEGEVIYDDYVYSNRINLPADLQKKYKIKGTYAEAAKKIQKESKERPNDPISKAGLNAAMNELSSRQELDRVFTEGNPNIFAKGGPIFNPYTKEWKVEDKPLKRTINKPWGKTVYTDDGFAVNYNKKGVEIGRTKGTQTPSIRGTVDEQRQKYFDIDTELTDSIKAISNRYGVNPNSVASRMAKEGGIDTWINNYNNSGGKELFSKSKPTKKQIKNPTIHPYNSSAWGMDWFTDRIKSGEQTLKEPWATYTEGKFINKFGTETHPAIFDTWNGVISGTASELKSRKDMLKKSYPKLNNSQLDALSRASYNMGHSEMKSAIKKKGLSNIINRYPNLINLKAKGGPNMDNLSLSGNIVDLISADNLPSLEFGKATLARKPLFGDFNESTLRYAPVLASGLSAISDIFTKPNYKAAKQVESVTINPPQVKATPVAQKLKYTPFDKQYYINNINKSAAASRRLANNISGGNRAAALNAVANTDYNYIEGLGKLARQAEEYNENLRQRVADFNRSTDMFNAQQSLAAQTTNAGYLDSATRLRLSQMEEAARLRQAARNAYDTRRSNNLNNFINNLGSMGWEATNREMINTNPALYYALSNLGTVKYKK